MKTLSFALLLLGVFIIPYANAEEEAPVEVPVVETDREPTSTKAQYVESPLKHGLDLQYVPANFPSYDFHNGFKTEKIGRGIHIGFEWLPFNSEYGKLGFGLGAGYYAVADVELLPEKKASLNAFPLEAFFSYRLDVLQDQILVPFGKIGIDATLVSQSSDAGYDIPGTRTYMGFSYGFGVQFLLDVFDNHSAHLLDGKFGINSTYLIFEYLRSEFLSRKDAPDMRRGEFRLGLRFEI